MYGSKTLYALAALSALGSKTPGGILLNTGQSEEGVVIDVLFVDLDLWWIGSKCTK
jgi:hypothetical protein